MKAKKLIILFCMLSLLLCKVTCMNKKMFNAINKNDIKTVKLLLDSGVDIDCRDIFEKEFLARVCNGSNVWCDYTPLILVVAYENSRIVKLLLKYGANMYLEDSFGSTALSFVSTSRHGMKIILDAIQDVEKLVKNNSFDKLCKIFAQEPVYDRYLLYYGLFQISSKKQFELLKKECAKNGILNLDDMLYNSSFPRLITHFLKKNIWLWRHDMFKKFPTLQQKKYMMIYQFNDLSVSKVAFDLLINYKN